MDASVSVCAAYDKSLRVLVAGSLLMELRTEVRSSSSARRGYGRTSTFFISCLHWQWHCQGRGHALKGAFITSERGYPSHAARPANYLA